MSTLLRLAHGTRSRYAKGCRCRPCTDANARYSLRHAWSKRGVIVEWPPGVSGDTIQHRKPRKDEDDLSG